MNRFILFIIIFLSIIPFACSSRKNKLDHRDMIPEKELTSIITDLYLSDGLLTLPRVHHWYSQLDSLSVYKEVIEKHGYTKETMDKTLKYYFVKKPKKLIKIYDQVLAVLSEMESRYEKEVIMMQSKLSNLWRGKDIYSIPDTSGNDSTDFEITVVNPSNYTLKFTVTLYPDDQSVNPRMTAYTCDPDSIETGKRHYIESINYIKDGQPHTYSLIVNALKKSDYHIRGLLYNYDNIQDDWGKHVIIEEISFTYTTAAL